MTYFSSGFLAKNLCDLPSPLMHLALHPSHPRFHHSNNIY
jgi:hypothetical protein